MKRVRVHELAKEFGTTSDAIMKLLWSRGFFVRASSSLVDSVAVEWLRFEFTAEPAPPPPVVKRETPPVPRPRWSPRPRLRRHEDPFSEWYWRPSARVDPSLASSRARPLLRSTRTVPVFGGKATELTSLDLSSIERGLSGSPYSLPSEQAEYLTTTFLPRVAALSIRAQREAQRISATRRAVLRRITRSTEIYESNRIEGLGPDLATTDRVLNQHDLHRRTDISVAHQAIHQCLTAEPKIRDVVGLGAARILAEIYCSSPERPLTESDVRQLHELIMVGDPQGGRYKVFVNRIEGSEHTPATPIDTPAAMAALVEWLACTTLAPLWRAAVTHAWLTHIHPFHDGNGRIARLLSNLVLIREGFPPLIVKASADRGPYLDALAASDEGGDILPLARVFRRVISRAVQDLAIPGLADHLFSAQLAAKPTTTHARWIGMLDEFLSELAPQLLLHRLNLYYVGEVTDAELLRIGSGRPENAWIAKVSGGAGARDLLLHVAAPSTLTRHLQPAASITPSVFVSVRSERPLDARQYLPVGDTTFTYEFVPLVESGTIAVRRAGNTSELSIHEAASAAADHLARAYRQLIGRPG